LANKGRGGFFFGIAVVGALGSLIGFLSHFFVSK
jgi:hypothetical protein